MSLTATAPIPTTHITTTGTMRAVSQSRYGSADALDVTTREIPTPAAGQVLVRVRAAGVDRGVWHLMTGRPYLIRVLGFGFRRPKQPVRGSDVAGTVVAVGPDVDRFTVGDEVFGTADGSFAEYAVARADRLASAPQSVSAAEAAVLAVSGTTAQHAVEDVADVQPGQHVLVLGASGGVGSYAVQLAASRGATVTGVASGAKADHVRSMGAERVVDYRTTDIAASGELFDVIIDTGGNTPLRRLRRILSPEGTLAIVGGEDGGSLTGGIGRQLTAALLSNFTSQTLAFFITPEHFAPLERLAAHVEAGHVRAPLTRRYPLAAAPDAIDDLVGGRIAGKAAVIVEEA
ncbi:NAD(P)-dependent alcohol dehydrogenase [Microbacterium awajiense]|uniref:NAD(P)-dependent alcohol dehydrogenase n=1 Tax=Microbacterium awajiense TaxID=415214 RepID=A0ABP7AGJ3_9MICO